MTSADKPPTFPQRRRWSGATHLLFFVTISLAGGLAGIGAAAMVGVLTRWEHLGLLEASGVVGSCLGFGFSFGPLGKRLPSVQPPPVRLLEGALIVPRYWNPLKERRFDLASLKRVDWGYSRKVGRMLALRFGRQDCVLTERAFADAGDLDRLLAAINAVPGGAGPFTAPLKGAAKSLALLALALAAALGRYLILEARADSAYRDAALGQNEAVVLAKLGKPDETLPCGGYLCWNGDQANPPRNEGQCKKWVRYNFFLHAFAFGYSSDGKLVSRFEYQSE